MIKIPIDKIILFILMALFITAPAGADTIYLKNGGSVDGIIEKEDEKNIEVNMGFGTVTFHKQEVKRIKRSSAEDNRKMARIWEVKRKELAARKQEFEEARDNRFKQAYEGWMEDARKKREIEGGESKDIKIARDGPMQSVVVETLLNEKVKAVLVLDTGASLVILSRKIGDELGLDFTDTKKDIVELKLADGRRTRAKAVILDSVRIQDVEVKKVMAAVMLDQLPGANLKDGLLGMSFLNRFNLKMDLKTMKMTLEKIDGQKE